MTSSSSAAYYDSIAAEYDTMLDRLPGDRWVRDAFRDLMRKTVKPGSLILDFGCGTGTDAAWYARQGFRITAYDKSTEMLKQVLKKCAEGIRSGAIVPLPGEWDSFVSAIGDLPPHDAVVSNFAVVNEIPDLKILFGVFADCLSPGGTLILSVLNPIRRRVTGRGNARRTHHPESRGEPGRPQMDTYLHRVREIEAAAGTRFEMVRRVSAGTFVDYDTGDYSWDRPLGLSAHLEKKLWTVPPFSGMGKFLFLVFRKR